MKQSKQTIIDAIVKEIEKGNGRGNVLGKIGKKWEISRTTFDRYWKTANEQQQERQRKASEAADKAYIESKADAAKEAVMSKQERLEVLTKMARGELLVEKIIVTSEGIKKVKTPPTHYDIKAAISELNKIEGDYAPTKVAQTDTKGNDVPKPNYDKLSAKELNTLLILEKKAACE